MIDLHNHILPVIDDGAKDWSETIKMAKQAVANGIHTIVATPHHQNGVYENPKDVVTKIVGDLNRMLQKEQIPLQVLPGQETQVYGDFLQDLKDNHIFTYDKNNKYVLLELPYSAVPRFIDQLVFDIQMEGYIPIIPHPERNAFIRENPLIIYQLVKHGALTQITAGSLIGVFGKEVQKFTTDLIQHNLTHLIATDAHRPTGHRGYNLKEAYEELGNIGGQMLVDIFQSNAEKIIQGKDIYVDTPYKIEKKKKIFGIF